MRKSNLKRLLTGAAIALGFVVTVALSAFSADVAAKAPNGLSQFARGAKAWHVGPSESVGQNFIPRASGLYAANQEETGQPSANDHGANQQGFNQQSEKSSSDDALFVSNKNDKDPAPDSDKGPCKHGKHKKNKHCVPSGNE